MRRFIMVAAVGLLVGVGVSSANGSVRADVRSSASRQCDRLVKVHGAQARGRDIVRFGVVAKRGHRAATLVELRGFREVCRRMLAPPPAPVLSTGYSVPAAPVSSGGGSYCGLFQFDAQTWASVGGSGSPCGASSSEQWSRAQELQRQRGNQPWPHCGDGGASLQQIAQCESGGDPSARG